MKFDIKIISLFLLLFLSLGSVNAITGICCYDGLLGITPRYQSSCDLGMVTISGFNTNPSCDFALAQVGCQLNNVCYGTLFGEKIYNLNEVKNYFQTEHGVNLDTYCTGGLVAYNPATCQANLNAAINVSSGNEGGSSGVGTTTGSRIDGTEYENTTALLQETEDMLFCSDAGGPFGLFATESNCESLTNDEGVTYPCFFNPYLSGYVSVFSQGEVSGLDPLETSCVAKSLIKSCFDYKSEINCEENPVSTDLAYTKPNLGSCRWVPTSDFFTEFVVDSGICVSDLVSEEKHYNIEAYTSRQNLLANPGFEKGNSGWSGEYEIISEKSDAYDGFSYALISASNPISQNISNLGTGVSYRSLLYLKNDASFTDENQITLTLTEYYQDGTFRPFVSNINLGDYSVKPSIFEKVVFPEHVVSRNVIKINVEISSDVNMIIDAISFERYDETSPITNEGVFKPLEIISSEASSCNLCFDETNLNFCTQEKSNLLGDCSYMVSNLSQGYESNLDKYLGMNDNIYYDNWSSQSLPNSLLFCEMYLSQTSCEEPNNYVNSNFGFLHYNSGNTLCKWDNTYGCYKDSDNSSGPDTKYSGQVYLKSMSPNNLLSNGYSNFGNYTFESTDVLKSDFAYSCDVMPAQSYLYFEAMNTSKDNLIITNNFPDQLLGNIWIDIEAYDVESESCSAYGIDKKIYVDYVINNQSHYRVANGALTKDYASIKDYFTDDTGELLLNEGMNNLSIIIKDQSGNVGKIRDYTLNVDLYGPNVVLTNPETVYGPNSTLNLSINDLSSVVSCNYTLEPFEGVVSNEGITIEDYDAQGELDISGVENNSNFTYYFELPIYKTSLNQNLYGLNITCMDQFGQQNSLFQPIYVDYSTEFVMVEPLGFSMYEANPGFLNSQKSLWAVSSERNLASCEMVTDEGSTSSLSLTSIFEGFNIISYSPSTIFYSNITGSIDFNEDGVHNVNITCRDNLGNSYAETFTYYYDTIKPEFINLSIESLTTTQKTALSVGNDYYTIRQNRNSYILPVSLNLSIDGTGSWMSNEDVNLFYWDGSNYVEIPDIVTTDFTLTNDSFTGNVLIRNFNDLRVYRGEDTDEQNLYLQKYNVSFTDKASNTGSSEINFYYDDSTPELIFGGDVNKDSGHLYTKVNNPTFNIEFNTPSYRQFSCSLDATWRGLRYNKIFNNTNSLNFSLSEFISGINFNQNESITFNFNCVDDYGLRLSNSYILIYDNTAPILRSVSLEKGNEIYLINDQNINYADIIDKLAFSFQNTGEVGYTCEYQFVSTDYTCDGSTYNSSFGTNSDLMFKTINYNLISDSSNSTICYRDRSTFDSLLETYRNDNNRTLNTKITIFAQCFDKVNLSTGIKQVDVNIDYVSGNRFVDLSIEYDGGDVIFVAKSLAQFDIVKIAYDDLGQNIVTQLTIDPSSNSNVYVYKGRKSIESLGSIENMNVWAIGYGSDGGIWDKISAGFSIDHTTPELSLYFPDMDEKGNIYFTDFEIGFNAFDLGGSKLADIELYLDDTLIYSASNLAGYDSGFLEEPSTLDNYFSVDNNNYFGRVVFKNAQIGKSYNFKVIAKDRFGNIVQKSKTVIVKDGIGIRLLDSTNSIVDVGGFSWITKFDAPIISFRTSKNVERCSIYPMQDLIWRDITGRNDLGQLSSTILGSEVAGNVYTFNLADFQGFNLSNLDFSRIDVLIRCNYNLTNYNFTRSLTLLDAVPDYVLTSSEGFVLADSPYETNIDVKSVGYYKPISCSYSIDNGAPISMGNGFMTSFERVVSMGNLINGEHTLKLSCIDKLEIQGPVKTYKFIVDKATTIQIENVTLFNGNTMYDEQNGRIYVNKNNLGLKFLTNKKSINCSYEIESSTGVFSRIINFIGNIFTDNMAQINRNSSSYEFKVDSGLSLVENASNKLKIQCSGEGFADAYQEYELIYSGSGNLGFDLSIS